MFWNVRRLSPLLPKIADSVELPWPATTLKDTVLGLIESKGAAELQVPFNVTGVFVEYPVTEFVVLTITSLDNGPTALGANKAVKFNVWPAVSVNGVVGILESLKF